MLHNKTDDIAMRAASEAVIKLFVIINGEGWRLFLMERTTRFKLPARTLHGNAPSDNFGQREAVANLVKKTRGNRHN